VSLNRVIAGVGPTFVHRDDHTGVEVMLDPTLLIDGRNVVRAYRVTDAAHLEPIEIG
jgi:hypothetical protein